ncbi:MAG TPA: putative Ig domain-containing protein [Gammaproteobacteria bacterium]|nr:putative Ig domain-containing protein [Gammaproteobacteria bacterium]
MTGDAEFFCLKIGKRMILLFALVGLAAGCGGGGGGGGAPSPVVAPGESTGQGGSGGVGLRISGSPPAEVLAGTRLSFTPTVHNPEQHALRFAAVNLPRWARVTASTGELSGIPVAADVGTYTGIRITVAGGGESQTSLPYAIEVVDGAAGSVTLTWNPPTQNADGTPLTDLAGYRIRYGQFPNALTRSVTIDNPGVTSVVIENLTAAVWYFAATAHNAEDVESAISNIVRIKIM